MVHPILFNQESVRAILDGKKTQTRRIISIRNTIRSEDTHTNHNTEITNVSGHRGIFWSFGLAWDVCGIEYYDQTSTKCPYGDVGDLLWVRESLRRYKKLDFLGDYIFNNEGHPLMQSGKWTAQYIATGTAVPYAPGAKAGWCGIALWEWKNKACPSIHMPRWASRITLEVTNISVERIQNIVDENEDSWNLDYGRTGYSWNSNPWVWVIDFKVL